MIAPTNIHPPKNWQDFETLCLKLWGEIWQIPHEIEFNSDNSQGQQGVDIYGPIDQGLSFYGIQCKNKKLNLIDGSSNRLTISDVQAEIDKAANFKPALKKLIIATSLPKDQKVEEYVRIKSLEHAQSGFFTIQICFWEFFERKILEFQKVNDWYLKNENFHKVSSFSVLFSGGVNEKLYRPKFQKTIHRYTTQKEPPVIAPDVLRLFKDPNLNISDFQKTLDDYYRLLDKTRDMKMPQIEWKQNCWFSLQLKNTGQKVIEDFKVELSFEGDFEQVGAESRNQLFNPGFTNNVKEYSNSDRALYIKPEQNILVQGEAISTGSIYLEPSMQGAADVKLIWKLLARDFEDSGMLFIRIDPKYHTVIQKHDVDQIEEERDEEVISLVNRPGSYGMMPGRGPNFLDKESDYNFE